MKNGPNSDARKVPPAFFGRRVLRWLKPIPKSPEARPGEAFNLTLVPEAALTDRFAAAIRQLEGFGRRVEAYVEFGVYNGTSLACMYRALEQTGRSARLVGFDSFEGLPPEVGEEDQGVWRPGQFSCPLEVTEARLAARSVDLEQVTLVKGWYRETLSRPPSTYGLERVSMVMIDSDCCSSARMALAFIEPALDDVAIIFFDDWKLNDLDLHGEGEYRAFKEFLSAGRWSAKALKSYNRKSMTFLLRRV